MALNKDLAKSGGLIQLFGAGILNVRAVLMAGIVEQHVIQASPVKDFATLCAIRKMLFFFRWKILVLVGRHRRTSTHSLRLASSNSITRSTLPVASRMRISP